MLVDLELRLRVEYLAKQGGSSVAFFSEKDVLSRSERRPIGAVNVWHKFISSPLASPKGRPFSEKKATINQRLFERGTRRGGGWLCVHCWRAREAFSRIVTNCATRGLKQLSSP